MENNLFKQDNTFDAPRNRLFSAIDSDIHMNYKNKIDFISLQNGLAKSYNNDDQPLNNNKSFAN